MLSNAERIARYKKQNGSDKLTPRQRRRVKAKAHRERDFTEPIIRHLEEEQDRAAEVRKIFEEGGELVLDEAAQAEGTLVPKHPHAEEINSDDDRGS